jgi:glycosyltransferase involved in cell wall biosynthesis
MTDLDAPRTFRLLTVIVPVFNERNTVAEILRRMRAVELPVDLEIVVVNDASSDGTEKVLAALEDSTVRVLNHPDNKGKGAAIRTGLQHARGDLVLVQDADLEYDPEDWPRLLTPIMRGKARIVYGSRFTGERKNMLFWHWVGNRFSSSSRRSRRSCSGGAIASTRCRSATPAASSTRARRSRGATASARSRRW